MNAETHLPYSISPRTTLRASTLLALCALAPAGAFADPPKAPAVETRAATVSLSGLDLSTPEGVRAAHERLRIVAQRLCAEVGNNRTISFRETYSACVRETLARAVQRIDAPTLAAHLRDTR